MKLKYPTSTGGTLGQTLEYVIVTWTQQLFPQCFPLLKVANTFNPCYEVWISPIASCLLSLILSLCPAVLTLFITPCCPSLPSWAAATAPPGTVPKTLLVSRLQQALIWSQKAPRECPFCTGWICTGSFDLVHTYGNGGFDPGPTQNRKGGWTSQMLNSSLKIFARFPSVLQM